MAQQIYNCGQKTVYWKEWYGKDIHFISDILDSKFCFLTGEDIQNKYNIKLNRHSRVDGEN